MHRKDIGYGKSPKLVFFLQINNSAAAWWIWPESLTGIKKIYQLYQNCKSTIFW